MRHLKAIISGGGTGGHIFPAISIADAIKARFPDAEILFVGAEKRMEMEYVPTAGYEIIGLSVAGFNRKNPFKNISVLWKLNKSLRRAREIVKQFCPDIAIGVGGYASAPLLKAAARETVPTLIQEQNSYAGITNKLLAKTAAKICVAYEGMEQFFPKDKIVLTGNPVRRNLVCSEEKRQEGYRYFDLDPQKKTIAVIGGSLGAYTINQSIAAFESEIGNNKDIQLIWQTGKHYYHKNEMAGRTNRASNIRVYEFISRMDLAYSVADLIISRAGAGSISELSLLGKPALLVPSPNVAEDHQTKNAQALVNNNAAVLLPDNAAERNLVPEALKLVRNNVRLNELSRNILKMALPDSANKIVDEIENILQK
jgi:UDP-N-acetylglucosamine--N-acetylmuramyl-(pentapeptide) pyrophosphoryl-undecaprenol N-acetylglucosamine transferase